MLLCVSHTAPTDYYNFYFLSGNTIFASSGATDMCGELSQIIKSTDSPDTLSERGIQDSHLGDVSFSALADLSMMRASREGTPFDKLTQSALSPIGHKSPDISMTPYLNCLTLDASSMSGGDSARRCDSQPGSVEQRGAADQDSSAVLDGNNSLSRSLFGTSTKRKRQSSEEEGEVTRVYTHFEQEQEDEGPRTAPLTRHRSTSSAHNTSALSQQASAAPAYATRTAQRLWAADADDSMLSVSAAYDVSYIGNNTTAAGLR